MDCCIYASKLVVISFLALAVTLYVFWQIRRDVAEIRRLKKER